MNKIPLSNAGTIVMGQSPPSSTYNQEYIGLPFYQGKADFGTINPKPSTWCPEPLKIAEPGSVVISVRAPVGTVNIVNEASGIGRGLASINPNPGWDSRYIYYSLLSQKQFIESLGTGTTFKSINKSQFGQITLEDKSLEEQKKIVYILSTIQNAVETQEKIIKTTTELKKALMQKLFTEGLYSEKQKQTEIGLVPESWEVKEFDQFTTLKRGKDLTKKDFQNGMIPVAGSHGIIGYHNSSYVDAPGITVGRSGSCGEVVYYNIAFWAHNTALFVSDFHRNNKKFAYYYLKHLNLGRFKTGASVPTLDRNSFKRLPIAIPELSEQKEIAQTLDSINKKIEITTKKQVSLQSLFNSMLHQLMSGKIRVNTL